MNENHKRTGSFPIGSRERIEREREREREERKRKKEMRDAPYAIN